jgi:hypothetical protein
MPRSLFVLLLTVSLAAVAAVGLASANLLAASAFSPASQALAGRP